MTNIPIPIEDFIGSVQEQVLNGLHNDFTLDGSIEIEVSVSKAAQIDGKVKLFVFQAGGEYDKENIAKVRFKIRPKLVTKGLGLEIKNEKLKDAFIQRPS